MRTNGKVRLTNNNYCVEKHISLGWLFLKSTGKGLELSLSHPLFRWLKLEHSHQLYNEFQRRCFRDFKQLVFWKEPPIMV